MTEDTGLLDDNRYSDFCRGQSIGGEVVGNDLMSYEDDRLNFGAGTVPSATLSRYLALLTRLELGVQAPPEAVSVS